MSKEPESTDIAATEWDKTPMTYNVVPPTDADGNPEGASPAEKAAATRTAKALAGARPRAKRARRTKPNPTPAVAPDIQGDSA